MIYLDNAATTPVSEEVVNRMKRYFDIDFANPSGLYEPAFNNQKVIDEGREIIAGVLNCSREEIYYTSGGTESDNWALKGVAYALKNKGNHIITSKIEHHAILNTCKFLKSQGYDITYIDVDDNGIVKLDELIKAIRKETILISIMTANNEVGSLQPVDKIGAIAKERGILFHTDAVQAFGHIPIDVKHCNIDLLSASSHKFGGPKGCGFLYVNKSFDIVPFMHGGSQENKKRAGTSNVSGIVGMVEAVKESNLNMQNRMAYEIRLRDYMIKRIFKEIPFCRINGDRYKRLPNNINFSFKNVEGQSIVVLLSEDGICVSSGSACSSSEKEPSHVLKAIGLTDELANGAVRFTLSHKNTKEEIDYTINKLKEIVFKLRISENKKKSVTNSMIV